MKRIVFAATVLALAIVGSLAPQTKIDPAIQLKPCPTCQAGPPGPPGPQGKPGTNSGSISQQRDFRQTLPAGQTTFATALPYLPGSLQVYMNGLLLTEGVDYTTSGTLNALGAFVGTISLTAPAPNPEAIDLLYWIATNQGV